MPDQAPLIPTTATPSRSVAGRQPSVAPRSVADRQPMADQSPKGGISLPAVPVLQKKPAPPNNTGLPDNLKTGMEQLSGLDMSDVQVHYNSEKPAQLNALAYAQGTDIHLGRGQEKHLPHEAWHVVQQIQGRVQPTVQRKTGIAINDDPALEKEADTMGATALQRRQTEPAADDQPPLVTAQGSHIHPEVSQLQLDELDEKFLRDHLTKYRSRYELNDDNLLEKVIRMIADAFHQWSDIELFRMEIVEEAIRTIQHGGFRLVWTPPEENVEMRPVPSAVVAQPPKLKDDYGMIDIEIPTMKALITSVGKWCGRPLMNKEAKNRALEALAHIVENIKEPDTFLLQAIIQPMLNAQQQYIALDAQAGSGTQNRKPLMQEQQGIIDEWVQKLQFQTRPKEDVTRPADIIYPEGATTIQKVGADGNPYDLGFKFQTITGKKGAAKGQEAAGSPASNYLIKTYGKNVNFVAGHLVTRRAGGTIVPANLAPFTQEFNQGFMRTPETKAENLLREDKVIRYSSEVRAWNPGELILVVPKEEDRKLIVAQIKVDITEMNLRDKGDPTNIAHWNIEGKSYSY